MALSKSRKFYGNRNETGVFFSCHTRKSGCFFEVSCYNGKSKDPNCLQREETEEKKMKIFKKICDVFGIILAWVLSIVLVVMLFVTPMTFSALSMLEADTITQVVTEVVNQFIPKDSAADYRVDRLTETTGTTANGNVLEDLLKDQVPAEVLESILSSNAAKEFLDTYAQDISNAITDSDAEPLLNAEKLKQIAGGNIDEIVDIVRQLDPTLTDKDTQKLKDAILVEVENNAEEFLNALPKPDQIIEEVTQENPELEMLLQILAMRDTIKMVIVGFIAALCLLIFLLRFPGCKGFRWVATDLFIGFGFNAILCFALLGTATSVNAMFAQQPELAGIAAALLSTFNKGMLIRTGVMLGAAVVLLVLYIIIKKARAKKNAADAYDIIILAGQSNAEGQGRGESTQPYVPNENVLLMTDNFDAHFVTTDGVSVLHYNWPAVNSIAVADEREKDGVKFGCFALEFARQYAQKRLQKGRKVLIVNANFGGTGFARPEWGVGNIMHTRLLSMTKAALATNPKNRIVAMLWSQGEHDSFENADWDAEKRYTTHKANLDATFSDIYAKLGGGFPIIACGFTDTFCQSLPEATDAVMKAICEMVAKYEGAVVDTKGLTSNSQAIGGEDIYHFSKESLRILGGKFFEKYEEVCAVRASK